MIKYIVQVSDIHIPNSIKRHEEFQIQLQKFLFQVSDMVSNYAFDEVRIVVCGDTLHNKGETSNEQLLIVSWFFRELNKIAKTIVFTGNHDTNLANLSRVDSITPVIQMLNLENLKYLDMELNHKSGIYVDDNIVWCLYSIFDEYRIPDIKIERVNHPDKTFIGLFHGPLIGSKTDVTFEFGSEHGISTDIFDGCDVVMCGDIHKFQELSGPNNIKIVYSSSIIQQNFGEAVSKHQFLLWDVETLEYTEHEIETDYGFYKFRINSVEDIEENTEEFVNF